MSQSRLVVVLGGLALVGCAKPGPVTLGESPPRAEEVVLEGVPHALDAGAGYMQVADAAALDLGPAFTLEAWVKPRQAEAGAFQHVISKWGGGGNASYTLTIHAGHLRSGVHDGVENTVLESAGTLASGVWQHVAVTFDCGVQRLYIDGVADTTQYGAVMPMRSTQPLTIGQERSLDHTGWRFDGLIDEVRIWRGVLPGERLARDRHRVLTGRERGLVGYWRFDEGAGIVARDLSGNGLDGTVRGAAWTTDAAPVR